MIPIDEVLEALGLPRAEPSLGYLQALFARFNERVPFETASKIVRNADVPEHRDKPRWPDVFWADHLALGTGGTCFARVAALEALLSGLGFSARFALGRVQGDFDHAALLVAIAGGDWICDVGFPLPALLPAAEGESETPQGPLRLTRTPEGWRVEMLGGVPEGLRQLEIFASPTPPENFFQHWRAMFRPDSKFLGGVSLRAERPGRTISFAAGEIRVDDLHSRTRIPLPTPRAAKLEEIFGVNRDLLGRALALAGDPEPAISRSEMSVYLETDAAPEAALDAIASPRGYERLMAGVGRVTREETAGGWRIRLFPGDDQGEAGGVEEDVEPEPGKLGLRVRRGAQESFYEAVRRGDRAFLVRRAVLSDSRLDPLRNDSLRGRLAGMLAVDLLAWARRLQR